MADPAPIPPTPDAPHQAGGGVSAEVRSVRELSPTVLTYLKKLYDSHAGSADRHHDRSGWRADDTAHFLSDVQQVASDGPYRDSPALPSALAWGFNDFCRYMASSATNVVAPPSPQAPADLAWPLSSYFVSSSHNTYLTGNQLYSDSSADAYKNVLLRGCRCIEIDVWDGDDSDSDTSVSSSDDEAAAARQKRDKVKKVKEKMPSSLVDRLERTTLGRKIQDKYVAPAPAPAGTGAEAGTTVPLEKKKSGGSTGSAGFVEPRVLHGYTLTKDVLFRDVCRSIRDYGFVVSDLPVIVSLEVHCCHEQQVAMVQIMQEEWAGYLLPEPEGEVTKLPSPGELRGKIIIKVKYAPPENAADGASLSSGGLSKTSTAASGTAAPAGAPAKKASKIIQALSKLGIYTRGVSFKSLTQPEASMPTHIFSLSENGVMEVHQKSARELFDHNKRYLMRAYPSGMRIGSSNLDPAVFWRKGIQIVALNWQKWDEGMMLNEGVFAGTGGYVLKPAGTPPFSLSPSRWTLLTQQGKRLPHRRHPTPLDAHHGPAGHRRPALYHGPDHRSPRGAVPPGPAGRHAGVVQAVPQGRGARRGAGRAARHRHPAQRARKGGRVQGQDQVAQGLRPRL